MKKQTLRGQGAFRALFDSGERVEAEVIRCFFLVRSGVGADLRIGFSVSSKAYSAVQRNRVRRLMREAFARERPYVMTALERTQTSALLLFVFKGKKGLDVNRIMLQPVYTDIAALCRAMGARLSLDTR